MNNSPDVIYTTGAARVQTQEGSEAGFWDTTKGVDDIEYIRKDLYTSYKAKLIALIDSSINAVRSATNFS